jgi:plasmid maintenance system antidote protein VapI/Zn-dependent peptidase ImmA (M78 family)
MTAAISEFRPDWASAPGDTIADIIDEQGLSVDEFATRIGQTLESTNDLLQGRATITIRTARQLEKVLGASVEFWIARDFQYREDMARIHATDEVWLSELPIGDMIRFGWLQPPPRPSEEVEACLRFFGVPSVAAWRQSYASLDGLVAFRTSPAFDSREGAVAAWIRKGEIECGNTECAPWNAARFRDSLQDIRRLTLEKDPSRFLPTLRQICAASGIATVVVRAPNGCRASGATRFVSRDKALLLLSFRYLSDDQFWFSFFHEAGHLLLHGHDRLFLEGLDTQSTAQEVEANEFAERVLVPVELKDALLRLPADTRAIARFAKRIGLSPGVVVGQLQHHGRVPRNHFNGLKRRFQWGEG